jgi:hypothetical protein
MIWQSDYIIEKSKEHLAALRESRDDIIGLIITSRQMIVRSYALLGIMDKIGTAVEPQSVSSEVA